MKNAILLFCTALIIFVVFWPSYMRIQEQQNEIAKYQCDVRSLEKKNKELIVERKRLIEDPVYLEQVAREKMGLVREGEVIFKIRQPPAAMKK